MIPLRRTLLSAIWTLGLLAGCAGPGRVVTEPPSTEPVVTAPGEPDAPTATPTAVVPERPLPAPLTLPAAFQQAVAQGTRTQDGRPGPGYWQQQARYRLTARLDPARKRLDGTGTIQYQNQSPDHLDKLHLELVLNLHQRGVQRSERVDITGGLTLSRVAVGGQALTEGNGYEIDGTQLVITPPAPVAPGATVEIETAWHFDVPRVGAGGRMGISRDDLFFLAYWYPIMAVYDDVEGWHTDPFLGQAEFYAGFGDYELTVEVPEGWLVQATGALENPEAVLAPDVLARLRQASTSDEPVQVLSSRDFGTRGTQESTDGWLRWRFSAEQVRDVAFSVTQASFWDAARASVGDRDGDGEDEYTQINAVYRTRAPRWKRAVTYGQHAMTFLSDFTGFPYPWPHMTAVEGAGIIGGGMEYPMITLIGDYTLASDEALYGVIAHEIAHMWVPMIVSTDERRYSWLDEGTTTYGEGQAMADRYPGSNYDLPEQQNYTAVARRGQEGPIMKWADLHNTTAYLTATYSKPATLLAALRGLLGDETFLEAYRAFIADWAFKHPYPTDFFNTFERISGRDLDWFWRSWYFETWTLDQAVADVRQQAGAVEIDVEDQGLAPMPARLAITLADGQTLWREVPVETWLSGTRRATVRIETDTPVQRVEIDPEQIFPDVDRRNNVWKL